MSPANNAVYGFYQNNVVSSFSCTDVSLASCVGTTTTGTPINTTTAGERSFRVTATDLVNLTTQVTYWYRVAVDVQLPGLPGADERRADPEPGGARRGGRRSASDRRMATAAS